MKEANAANVSWDYIGNGYISPNSVASYDVYRDFDVQSPDVNTVTVNGKKKQPSLGMFFLTQMDAELKK